MCVCVRGARGVRASREGEGLFQALDRGASLYLAAAALAQPRLARLGELARAPAPARGCGRPGEAHSLRRKSPRAPLAAQALGSALISPLPPPLMSQLEDWILSPRPSSSAMPSSSQTGLSGMVLLFWSPPLQK